MKKYSLKKQNRHLLWMAMEFAIGRYLLSNIHSRANGAEKAERHIEISSIFIASKLLCSIDDAKYKHWDSMMKIHDATIKLTDNLDKIGFDIYDDCPENLSDLELKFFDRFLDLAEKEWDKFIASDCSLKSE